MLQQPVRCDPGHDEVDDKHFHMISLVVLVHNAQPLLDRRPVLFVFKLIDQKPLRPVEVERRLRGGLIGYCSETLLFLPVFLWTYLKTRGRGNLAF